MAKSKPKLYGLLAKFDSSEHLIAAVKRVAQSGYRRFDAYTPYPVEELDRAMRLKPSPLPYVILGGGILGGVGGFFMQAYAQVVDLPLNIGGRPLFSWPAYVPISFELTVLLGAVFGILGLFAATRFPQPYHPVFNSEDFNEHGSQDAFYLDIEAADPSFDLERTRKFMEELGAIMVSEIEA
jgi:hypothetical protein